MHTASQSSPSSTQTVSSFFTIITQSFLHTDFQELIPATYMYIVLEQFSFPNFVILHFETHLHKRARILYTSDTRQPNFIKYTATSLNLIHLFLLQRNFSPQLYGPCMHLPERLLHSAVRNLTSPAFGRRRGVQTSQYTLRMRRTITTYHVPWYIPPQNTRRFVYIAHAPIIQCL